MVVHFTDTKRIVRKYLEELHTNIPDDLSKIEKNLQTIITGKDLQKDTCY